MYRRQRDEVRHNERNNIIDMKDYRWPQMYRTGKQTLAKIWQIIKVTDDQSKQKLRPSSEIELQMYSTQVRTKNNPNN